MPEFTHPAEVEPIGFEPVSFSLWGPAPKEYRLLQRFDPSELGEAAEACRDAACFCDGMTVLVADGPNGESVAVMCHDLPETLCVGETEIDSPGVEWRHPQLDGMNPSGVIRP